MLDQYDAVVIEQRNFRDGIAEGQVGLYDAVLAREPVGRRVAAFLLVLVHQTVTPKWLATLLPAMPSQIFRLLSTHFQYFVEKSIYRLKYSCFRCVNRGGLSCE